jgi:hypothetical protein
VEGTGCCGGLTHGLNYFSVREKAIQKNAKNRKLTITFEFNEVSKCRD